MDITGAEPRRRRIPPAAFGVLAVAGVLVAALLVSLVPAREFGPLLPVGRVLKEHVRSRHHHDPPARDAVTGPGTRPYRPEPARPGRRHVQGRLPAPRQTRRPHLWRHSRNPLGSGLHHLQCKLFPRHC